MHSVFVCRAHLFCLCECHYLSSLTPSGNLPHALWQASKSSSSQLEFYLLAASQPLRDIATMMLEPGCGRTKCAAFAARTFISTRASSSNPFGKTKAARRKVPLTEKASALLGRRLEKVTGDFVFPGRATDQSSK